MLHNFGLTFASVRTHPRPPRAASFVAVIASVQFHFLLANYEAFKRAVITHAGILFMFFSSPRSHSRGEDPSPFPPSQQEQGPRKITEQLRAPPALTDRTLVWYPAVMCIKCWFIMSRGSDTIFWPAHRHRYIHTSFPPFLIFKKSGVNC